MPDAPIAPSSPPTAAKSHRLAHEQSQYRAASKAQRLQQRNFASAFADRHRHGVRRHQQRGKHHRRADAQNERLHVAQHRDPVEVKGLLALRLGGPVGVAEGRVDVLRHLRHCLRRIRQHAKKPDKPLIRA